MGDMADYYGDQEIGEDYLEDLGCVGKVQIMQMRPGVYVQGMKQPLSLVPEGYWRQRNGKLIQIAAMGLQHLANTLRMIERNAKGGQVSRSWKPLQKEWLNRGLKDGEWNKPHFSQETYEEMLKSR